MQESQLLKSRKINIIFPKTTKNIENIHELKESEKSNKKIKRVYPPIPDLHLPVKKVLHVTNRKDKNKKLNKISFEKLRQLVVNLRMNKKEKNQDRKKHIKRTIKTITKNNKDNNKNMKHHCKTITAEKNKDPNIIKNDNNNNIINPKIREFNYDTDIINNNFEDEKNKERNKSLKNDLNIIRNDDSKKWYDINYLTEKYNDLIMTTENLEKNLVCNYLNGTDNIISEIEEPQYIKEDSEVNTLNANISLRKHLSIRETTLDTSYQGNSYYNYTDKYIGKTNGFNGRIKNYRKLFKKYKTNLNLNHYGKNRNIFNNKYNLEKRRKKVPSFNGINTQNNSANKSKSIIERNSNHRINSCSINIVENLRDSKNSINSNSNINIYNKQRCISVYKNRRNLKNRNDNQKNNNQFLTIINEANDLIKSDGKKRYPRPKSKNANQNENRFYNLKRYNCKFIRNKFKKLKEPINDINPINLFIAEKRRYLRNHHYITHINDNIISSINDYIIDKSLGIGSYAEVKLGIHKKTKKKYAIKIYPKTTLDDEDKNNSIKNEVFILNKLNHENIMKLYDIINSPKYLYLILEYINGISLLDFIHKLPNKRIEENICKKIFYQIVNAIHYCSKKNIYHRDIKLENILLIIHNDSIKVKLIDFGFAIKSSKKEFQKFFCGTLYYMAPEIINKKKYLPYYSDIWSLGVLLYTMIYGRFPFNAKDNDKLFDLINEGKVEFPEDIDTSDEVKNLINKIIIVEPNKRASLNDIINDIWFKN